MEAKGSAVTVGTFDGVHIGHRKVLARLVGEARKRGLKAVALTFAEPPSNFFGQRKALLCTLERRVEMIRGLGVEEVMVMDFPDVRDMKPEDFVEKILLTELDCRLFVSSKGFIFGAGRKGDMVAMNAFGEKYGFGVLEVKLEAYKDESVSSSRIRKALESGEVSLASRLLGYAPFVSGTAVSGRRVGRKLGFPTINLELEPGLTKPADGIYVAALRADGKEYPGSLYIGTRPTFDGTETAIEIHLLVPAPQIAKADIILLKRLRGDKKFSGEEELKKAIADDVKRTKAYFRAKGHRLR